MCSCPLPKQVEESLFRAKAVSVVVVLVVEEEG